MTSFISNHSKVAVEQGFHPLDPKKETVLIRIIDPGMVLDKPSKAFSKIHVFEFLDLEEDSQETFGKITDLQARQLVEILKEALIKDQNVLVHCVAGICRSGAVCEVGVMMGFGDGLTYRQPNLLVKKKMMQVLDWLY